MDDFERTLNESLKDPEFKKLWEETECAYLLAKSLIEAMHSANISAKKLAKKSGVSKSTVSDILLMDGNPSLKDLRRIADALGMDLSVRFVPKTDNNRS